MSPGFFVFCPTQDKQVKQAQANLDPRLFLIRPSNIYQPINRRIRIRKRSSYIERNNFNNNIKSPSNKTMPPSIANSDRKN